MNNAQFFLLMKALGFSTADEVHQYIAIRKFRGYTSLKAIQTWLDAGNQQNKLIPSDVIDHFKGLHVEMLKKTENPYYQKAHCLYLYNDAQEMWSLLPHLKGLPLQYLINFYILLVLKHGNLNFRFYKAKN
ncbi:hypothetical protein [Acinetobacter soli]|uniref:hypothetical protein n=1 Tax=Acinetobacter soli TaxID=487316 RepID=UPI00125E5BEE|nr:hypothetical protein [Acinetobacter soli]